MSEQEKKTPLLHIENLRNRLLVANWLKANVFKSFVLPKNLTLAEGRFVKHCYY